MKMSKDICEMKDAVLLGLSAKQLGHSIGALSVGAAIVIGLNKITGLTAAVYIALPFVVPIALGGYYSLNGMSIYEVFIRRIKLLFFNRPLPYISMEDKTQEMARDELKRKKEGGLIERFLEKLLNAKKA